ncbi:hypothetical protein PLESTB_001298500 [Pleodorina starrii]|uniref:Uncharacterized protein n=1 Tax=Pleodorina starrii TaxID=330485 RepID=A0A9W6F652_9CHLO|nr:hypothetical protein PLESTM_000847600 [Pleodorina starrii]GLC39147.1 hypothetical protein PLESTM_000856400 [Pleodorina starrii]GLC57957.1 hypothetical protein PLESTB_001298500 [Pleodorina starrii]GLC76753.1 hypothetical protein PLESTF_001829900 [Pleodorina starrii]
MATFPKLVNVCDICEGGEDYCYLCAALAPFPDFLDSSSLDAPEPAAPAIGSVIPPYHHLHEDLKNEGETAATQAAVKVFEGGQQPPPRRPNEAASQGPHRAAPPSQQEANRQEASGGGGVGAAAEPAASSGHCRICEAMICSTMNAGLGARKEEAATGPREYHFISASRQQLQLAPCWLPLPATQQQQHSQPRSFPCAEKRSSTASPSRSCSSGGAGLSSSSSDFSSSDRSDRSVGHIRRGKHTLLVQPRLAPTRPELVSPGPSSAASIGPLITAPLVPPSPAHRGGAGMWGGRRPTRGSNVERGSQGPLGSRPQWRGAATRGGGQQAFERMYTGGSRRGAAAGFRLQGSVPSRRAAAAAAAAAAGYDGDETAAFENLSPAVRAKIHSVLYSCYPYIMAEHFDAALLHRLLQLQCHFGEASAVSALDTIETAIGLENIWNMPAFIATRLMDFQQQVVWWKDPRGYALHQLAPDLIAVLDDLVGSRDTGLSWMHFDPKVLGIIRQFESPDVIRQCLSRVCAAELSFVTNVPAYLYTLLRATKQATAAHLRQQQQQGQQLQQQAWQHAMRQQLEEEVQEDGGIGSGFGFGGGQGGWYGSSAGVYNAYNMYGMGDRGWFDSRGGCDDYGRCC